MPRHAYTHTCQTHLYSWSGTSCYLMYSCFKWYECEVLAYAVLACSYYVGWFLWFTSIVRPRLLLIPTKAATQKLQYLFNQSYGSISHHIMPLVITSLGGGHTDTHIQTLHRQDHFLETRCVLAYGRNMPSLATFTSKFSTCSSRHHRKHENGVKWDVLQWFYSLFWSG